VHSDLRHEVVGAIDADTAVRVRALMDRALPLELHDDRFDAWPTGPTDAPVAVTAALASAGTDLVGYLGGPVDGRLAQLDALVAPGPAAPDDVLDTLLTAVAPTLDDLATERVELWAKPAQPWHTAIAQRRSLTEIRALHQMRCPLPVEIDPVPTRSYTAADLEALCSVNNRAFHAHPDQGSQTAESLAATMAEPWFDPDGLRIHERDGRMVGFCWTKIHPPRSGRSDPGARSEALGEIYVIGVDPDFHGQGLGAPMTAAGLDWLHGQGLSTGMLYVEADNTPAVRTYERLGFTIVRTDRAWLLR
jgi:mycothiol synthase